MVTARAGGAVRSQFQPDVVPNEITKIDVT
jgi:hypothetical protein